MFIIYSSAGYIEVPSTFPCMFGPQHRHVSGLLCKPRKVSYMIILFLQFYQPLLMVRTLFCV